MPSLFVGAIVRRNPTIWPRDDARSGLRIIAQSKTPRGWLCQRIDLRGKPLMEKDEFTGAKREARPVFYQCDELRLATLIVGVGVR